METKKGIQLNQAFGAVLTLVLVAVLIIIAIFIFVSLTSTFAGSASDRTLVNETLTMVNESGVALPASLTNCSASDYKILAANNDSGLINAANYSLSSDGILTFASGGSDETGLNNTAWLVTSSWTWGSQACESSEDMTIEFANYTSLVGLVGTIIFLGLVIGILVSAFVFGGRRDV